MQISEAESRVISVLWERGSATAEEVIGVLKDQSDWQDATVKTLLNRLLNKGAISAEAEGRRYRYRPLLKQSDWVLEESRGLLDRWFDGRLAPLVAHFNAHGELSRDDIDELRKLIEELDHGQ